MNTSKKTPTRFRVITTERTHAVGVLPFGGLLYRTVDVVVAGATPIVIPFAASNPEASRIIQC
jgi:hypothetical protein